MAISETMLHPYIKGLVEEYGALTVTELNILLREILDLDEVDLTVLSGRKDDKFSQIVRNVVSHVAQGEVLERNGYIIDKRERPAIFTTVSPRMINEINRPIVERIITTEEVEARKEKKRKFKARKVDYKEINEERTLIGDAGERFVLDWERNRLRELEVQFDVLDEVQHFSKLYGDGSGYDILSRQNEFGEPLYIEVKTTKGGLETSFYMSENERQFMKVNSNNCLIYRVYNFDYDSNMGEVEIISYTDLVSKYTFNPITYRVTKNLI